MQNQKHTPGPWGLHIGDDYTRVLMKPDSCTDDMIAEVYGDGAGSTYEEDALNRKANAYLITAAPDMYEALQRILARSEGKKSRACLLNAASARAALAKAEGK